jgi:hypothetical protein
MGRAPEKRLWFRSDHVPLDRNGAALLCLGLLPAMEVNAPLHISEPLPRQLVGSLPALRQLITDWYPGTTNTPIHCPVSEPTHSKIGHQTALCFSAGVDSSYSLAIEQKRIDCLITLVGADVAVNDAVRAERLRQSAQEVAHAYGKTLYVIETNVREIFDRRIGWGEYHGAVLAAVGHLLRQHVRHLLIASSADEASWQRPCGTHPALDHLWGSETLGIEHHAMVPRFSKVARLISETPLMRHLRVCDDDDHNCGRCPDCQFMLRALDVLQAYPHAPTFCQLNARMRRIAIGLEEYGTHNDYLDLRATAITTTNATMGAMIECITHAPPVVMSMMSGSSAPSARTR